MPSAPRYFSRAFEPSDEKHGASGSHAESVSCELPALDQLPQHALQIVVAPPRGDDREQSELLLPLLPTSHSRIHFVLHAVDKMIIATLVVKNYRK